MALNARRFTPRTQSQPQQAAPAQAPREPRQRDPNELGAGWSKLIKGGKGDFCIVSLKINREALETYIGELEAAGEDVSSTITIELKERRNKGNPKAPDYVAQIPWKYQQRQNDRA